MATNIAYIAEEPRRSTLAILILCVAIFVLEGVDMQLLALALPVMIGDWRLSQVDFAPALAAASVGMIIGSVIGGVLGDKWGRRPVLLVSVILFGALTVLVGAAHSPIQIAFLRLLGGIGFGAIFPNVIALASESSPADQRTRNVTIITLGVPLGSMLGALCLGPVLPMVGWRACFFAAGALTVVFGILLLFCLPESPVFKDKVAGRRNGATGGDEIGAARLSGRRVSVLSLFERDYRRRTLGLWLFAFSLGYVIHGFAHWQPTMLTMAGLSLRAAITSGFFTSLFMAAAPFACAWVMARYGSRFNMLMSVALYILAHLMLAVILAGSIELSSTVRTVAVMAALSIAGFAGGQAVGCQFALSAHAYPDESRATGAGFTSGVGRVSSVATAFGGAAMLTTMGPIGFIVLGIVSLVVAGLATLLIDAHVAPVAITAAQD